VLAQGTIGYVQYFTGLPEVLVGAHMLGACFVWIATLQLWLRSTERTPDGSEPELIAAASAGTAA
jgi:cytochrome c oxidase assembly protein subunit 15